MSFARVFYPASGTDYNIPFSYQDASEVYVSVTGIQVLPGGGTWSFLNPSTIRFISTPAGTVQIRRVTQKASNKTTYADGVVDVSVSRNLEDTQLLYSVQEAMDFATDAIGLDETIGTAFTARSKRIEDLGSPVGDNDAASRLWVLNDTVSFNFSTNEMDAHGYRIQDVASPVADTDAASKVYVDNRIAAIVLSTFGISSSGVCVVASPANFPGIDPSGATNSAVGLNNALAASVTAKVPLFIPPGRYEVGNSFLNVTSPVQIIGSGVGRTVFSRNVDSINPIIFIQSSDVTVRDISFLYTGPNPTVSSFHSPVCAFAPTGPAISRIRLFDLSCSGGFYVGFVFDNVSDGWMERCYALGCVDRGFYVYLACNTIRIESCIADGLVTSVTGYTPTHNGFYGFNMNPGGTTTLTDIVFSNCLARNVSAHGFASSERVYNSKITGCQAQNIISYLGDHSAVGFLVQLANGFGGERTTITDCAAITCDIGFEVTQSTLVTLDGCRANNSPNKAVWIVNSDNCQVLGGQFESGGVGNSAAIYLQTATKCQIVGSSMYGHLYGIFEDVNSDRNIIASNIALTNSSAQIARNGTNQVTANNITT